MENEVVEEKVSQQYEAVVYRNTDVENYQFKQLTVGDESKSNSTFMYFSAITANLLIFSCTSGLGWTSPVIPTLSSHNPKVNPLGRPVTPLEISWIASLLVLGAAFGPLVIAKLGDLLGRKKALICISIPHILSIITLAYASDVRVFYVTRFVSGFVMGSAFGLVPVYLAEIAEMRNRGTVGALMSIFITIGILYSFVIGPLVSVKTLTLCCVAPGIVFLVVFSLVIPESPVYLASKGDTQGASHVLMKLRGRTADQVQHELRLILKALEEEKQEMSSGGVTELFTDAGLRKSLVICLGLFMFQQFSGLNVLTAFLEQIFAASGSSMSKYVSTNVVMLTQFFSSILATAIVERFPKRSLLMLSTTGTFLSLWFLALYFYLKTNTTYNIDFLFWLPIASMISFFIMLGGLAALPWGLVSEIFPTKFRATAGCLASFACFFSSFLVTLGFPLVLQIFGMSHCFWFFSGCMLMCTVFVYCLVPETAGKTSAEIQEILRK
ncbi:unnamed protein product [Phaedon cochleariae]|uniref:Major facilitator superfamily (MFS) profile domain-containing protein n=1 Tax=Phaedon cochleariae TaxID=80249 RepID=A0A9P0DE42_PHACE|nr:unnamed protein product [Phaedon cochleariae]